MLLLVLPACAALQVYETEDGKLRSVLGAIKRGRQMRCTQCGHRGATLGCRVPSCSCRWVQQAMHRLLENSVDGLSTSSMIASGAARHAPRGRRCCVAAEMQQALRWYRSCLCSAAACRSYHVACAKDAGCTYYCEQYQASAA